MTIYRRSELGQIERIEQDLRGLNPALVSDTTCLQLTEADEGPRQFAGGMLFEASRFYTGKVEEPKKVVQAFRETDIPPDLE